MIAVIQRVSRASVKAHGHEVSINKGLLVLVGVGLTDSEKDASLLAKKTRELRIFEDDDGKMNLGLMDVKGQALVVSQFTLFADCKKGRRPSFTNAAPPEKGNLLYEKFVDYLKADGAVVKTGKFGAHMDVELVNDGPVTIILNSEDLK